MDPVENINITFSVLLLGQCHTQEEKKFQFHSKCGNKSPFVSSPPSLWHKLMTPILSFSVKGYKMKQWLSCFSSSTLTVSKSTTGGRFFRIGLVAHVHDSRWDPWLSNQGFHKCAWEINIVSKVSGPVVDCSGMAPWHIAMAQVFALGGKTMVPIKVCGNQ